MVVEPGASATIDVTVPFGTTAIEVTAQDVLIAAADVTITPPSPPTPTAPPATSPPASVPPQGRPLADTGLSPLGTLGGSAAALVVAGSLALLGSRRAQRSTQ